MVTAARAYWRPKLPLPCARCRRPVVPILGVRWEGWTVDHVIRRTDGGALGVENQWPAHTRCNTRDGGKIGGARGAAVTNARRARRTTPKRRQLEDSPLAW